VLESINYAHNPLLPTSEFIPDVEARQWQDKRLYLYGSYDIAGRADYCSAAYHVYSSLDMVNWTDHGESFRSSGEGSKVEWTDSILYAPDVVYNNGIYYLYLCLSDESEGVASSHSPFGPFEKATRIDSMRGIDPGAFIDDDGQAYIYWGQFDNVRAAKLLPDMCGIDESTVVQPLSVADHNFHEGSFDAKTQRHLLLCVRRHWQTRW
jgi:beta-xylosidase